MFLELTLSLLALAIGFSVMFKKVIAQHASNIQEKNQEFHHKLIQEISQNQTNTVTQLTESMLKQQSVHKSDTLQTILNTLKHQHDQTSSTQKTLTDTLHQRLFDISNQVDKRLETGFEKTNQVFHDVVKRLSLIDQAQKKITDLSENVVALQDILTDKSSRGAFGEVQLEQLVANIMPAQHYQMQATLPNGKRADCLLFLPEPSGHIVIDSKFPLENYQRQFNTSDAQKRAAEQQFKLDVKKHINDIQERYIVPEYTAQGAMMFIPAEAIFSHIHAHLPEIVAYAHKQKVWITSPTTLMAVLNTALSVIKDHATRGQMDIIKQHLAHLSQDFERFDKRMNQLARHIGQANKDVDMIQQSSSKITKRFHKIEACELDTIQVDIPELTE